MEPALCVRVDGGTFEHAWRVSVAGMPLWIGRVRWPLGLSEHVGHVGAGPSLSLRKMSEPSTPTCVGTISP